MFFRSFIDQIRGNSNYNKITSSSFSFRFRTFTRPVVFTLLSSRIWSANGTNLSPPSEADFVIFVFFDLPMFLFFTCCLTKRPSFLWRATCIHNRYGVDRYPRSARQTSNFICFSGLFLHFGDSGVFYNQEEGCSEWDRADYRSGARDRERGRAGVRQTGGASGHLGHQPGNPSLINTPPKKCFLISNVVKLVKLLTPTRYIHVHFGYMDYLLFLSTWTPFAITAYSVRL